MGAVLGVTLELQIYAPDIEYPLMVNAASVQWMSDQTFGLAFFWITDAEINVGVGSATIRCRSRGLATPVTYQESE